MPTGETDLTKILQGLVPVLHPGSLEAIGLTAAFSRALAERRISCNCIAAYHHDHIFVPAKDADLAMETLRELAGIT